MHKVLLVLLVQLVLRVLPVHKALPVLRAVEHLIRLMILAARVWVVR